MKINRNIVSTYLAIIFLVVGLSGILMFFHILDEYTNVVHEILGLIFVIFAILHIIINWKNIVTYGRNKKLFIPCLVILFVSISLIVIGNAKGNIERELLERIIKSPVSYSFKTLNIDYNQANSILRQHNIIVKDSLQSLEEISIKNKKSPEEIIALIFK